MDRSSPILSSRWIEDPGPLLEWIRRIHVERADPSVLKGLAEWLSERFGGAFVAIFPSVETQEASGRLTCTSALDPRFREVYLRLCPEGLPWIGSFRDRLGELLYMKEQISEAEVLETAFYREFMRPQGFLPVEVVSSYQHGTAGFPGFGWGIYGVRPFTRGDLELCSHVDAHLAVACRQRGELRASDHGLATTRAVLDSAPLGVVQLDGTGAVRWISAPMRMILAKDDGLSLDDGRLRTHAAEDQGPLDQLVMQAIGRGVEPQAASVSRSAGRPPLSVMLVRGAPLADQAPGDLIASLLVVDPDLHTVPDAPLLERLYGLTPAESRLAVAIALGETVGAFAVRTERSPETVRTQLKSVFRKLGVQRQGDLVRVLGRSGVMLAPDESAAADR